MEEEILMLRHTSSGHGRGHDRVHDAAGRQQKKHRHSEAHAFNFLIE
ncbi:hypothetical protein [Bacillus sp. FJAT-42376]|nr:hypothetical protein [Bacillus sp. FJAT-42376]